MDVDSSMARYAGVLNRKVRRGLRCGHTLTFVRAVGEKGTPGAYWSGAGFVRWCDYACVGFQFLL